MKSLFILGLIFWVESNVLAETKPTLIAASGPERVQLVELYTSESCSSCPPADEWISELKNNSQLWKKFVPIAFHVDYWNNLGWKDGLSSEAMTKRQVQLSQLWSTPSVYTPSFIVDGKEWGAWRNSVNHALPAVAASSDIKLSLYKKTDETFLVQVDAKKSKKHFNVKMAQLGFDLISDVTSGENSGKHLKNNFAVIDLQGKGLLGEEQTFTFKKPTQKASRFAIVAWIEEDGNPTPLQAVGGYL